LYISENLCCVDDYELILSKYDLLSSENYLESNQELSERAECYIKFSGVYSLHVGVKL